MKSETCSRLHDEYADLYLKLKDKSLPLFLQKTDQGRLHRLEVQLEEYIDNVPSDIASNKDSAQASANELTNIPFKYIVIDENDADVIIQSEIDSQDPNDNE